MPWPKHPWHSSTDNSTGGQKDHSQGSSGALCWPADLPEGQEAAAGLRKETCKKLLGRFGFFRFCFFWSFLGLCLPRACVAVRAKPFETQLICFARHSFLILLPFAFGWFFGCFFSLFFLAFSPWAFAAVSGRPFKRPGFGFDCRFCSKAPF